MSYRDILVHLDDKVDGSPYIEAVVAFASSQNAHLAGLHVVDIPDIPGFVESNLPRDLLENHRKLFFDQAERIESVFGQICEKNGLSFDWRCVEGDTAKSVIHAARYADLVVVIGGAGIESEDRTNVADRVVLESGRPVLVVPAIGTGSTIGSKVAIAWSASKEAVRATHDALPLLENAEWVKLVSVNPQTSDDKHGDIPGMSIAAHLERHGVRPEAHSITVDDSDTGEGLLDWAKDNGADLIVMGAYGHTRWRELVLGGVTAYVLRYARVPVLMSH